MIEDQETNTLFLSGLLEAAYPRFFAKFKTALVEHGVSFHFLPHTKDVWCVDFMPIQVDEKEFVQFKFAPRYLKPKKYRNTISDPSLICANIGVKPTVTDIIADGGNVTRIKNKVIMTDSVIEENPHYSEGELKDKIIEQLGIDQLIIIPTQPHDFTGHSDGMVRFLDEKTVLINDYAEEPNQKFVRNTHAALKNAGLDLVEIPTSQYENKDYTDASGNYINFLQMNGIIFLPTFNRKEDDQVIGMFEELFPSSRIVPVESSELAKDGGILNCISWNIKA